MAAHPEPYIVGMRTVALEPSTEHRRKDSDKRLIAGVIERYGEPEERMGANYRRYVREYPLVGQALRSMAAEGRPALIHLSLIHISLQAIADCNTIAKSLAENGYDSVEIKVEAHYLHEEKPRDDSDE